MKRTNFGKRFLRGLCRWAGLIGWAVAVGGCGSEPAAEVDPWLEVTPDVVSFGSDEVGIVRRVEVRSHAAAFSTRVVYYGQEQEWLEVVRDRAGVELAARTVNRGGEARHAAVTVEVAGTGPQTISVTQRGTDDGTDYGIQLEPSSLRLAASGQEATGVVRIVTAGDGVSAESGAGWCTVRLSGDLLQVTAGEHADRQARTCAVTVSNAQGETAELAVWQAGADDSPVVLEPDRLTFAASGTDLSRTVAVHTAGTGITAHTITLSPTLKSCTSLPILVITPHISCPTALPKRYGSEAQPVAHKCASLVQGDQISGLINAPVGHGSSGIGQRSLTAIVFLPVITTPLRYSIIVPLFYTSLQKYYSSGVTVKEATLC